MDPISDLDFFVRLARLGSLSAAAQDMGVTPPTASKRLAALEQRLGVRLFHRTTRRISLSAEGEAYLASGTRLLEDLHVLEETLASGQATPQGLLRVHATLGFGRRFITPLVSSFLRRYPRVDVQLHLSERSAGLVEQGFDLAVRVGEEGDSRLTTRKLASNRRIVCASPHYLARAGTPADPEQLSAHRCIVIRESDDTYGSWPLSSAEQNRVVKVRGALSTNDGTSALDWALDGHGILMRSLWEVAPYLRSGRLQRVLPQWSLAADISVVFPTRLHLSAKTRAFIDHLVEAFAQRARDSGDPAMPW